LSKRLEKEKAEEDAAAAEKKELMKIVKEEDAKAKAIA